MFFYEFGGDLGRLVEEISSFSSRVFVLGLFWDFGWRKVWEYWSYWIVI